MVAEAAPSQMSLKIIQASLDGRIAIRGIPFLADVESRYVPDSWSLFGRIEVMVGGATDVSSELFHGFINIVDRSWPRRTELQPHIQKGLGSSRN